MSALGPRTRRLARRDSRQSIVVVSPSGGGPARPAQDSNAAATAQSPRCRVVTTPAARAPRPQSATLAGGSPRGPGGRGPSGRDEVAPGSLQSLRGRPRHIVRRAPEAETQPGWPRTSRLGFGLQELRSPSPRAPRRSGSAPRRARSARASSPGTVAAIGADGPKTGERGARGRCGMSVSGTVKAIRPVSFTLETVAGECTSASGTLRYATGNPGTWRLRRDRAPRTAPRRAGVGGPALVGGAW